jgi:predicted RNase H-like HicB family nuclease
MPCPAPIHARARAVFGTRVAEEIMSAYHVTYERDESGWWVASVREVRGCHTQGRTVDEARRRIRKAMELFVDHARSAKLVDNVKLPASASKAIRLYAALRKQADREDHRASLAARCAVRLLRGGRLKMSARDAARLLGVSHQRVHQLVHDAGRTVRAFRPTRRRCGHAAPAPRLSASDSQRVGAALLCETDRALQDQRESQ